MKNATKNVIFPQELVDELMNSFNEDSSQITRLSSPLSSLNFNESDEQN